MNVLSLTNPVVQAYIVHSIILAIKLIAMSGMTALVRLTLKVFANPEDARVLKGKVKYDEPTVERVRRAHLNDLENIPAFWIIAGFYLTTNPAAAWATLLFRMYTVCRIAHTIVYAVIPWQPMRAIVFLIAAAIKYYMGIQVILYYIAFV